LGAYTSTEFRSDLTAAKANGLLVYPLTPGRLGGHGLLHYGSPTLKGLTTYYVLFFIVAVKYLPPSGLTVSAAYVLTGPRSPAFSRSDFAGTIVSGLSVAKLGDLNDEIFAMTTAGHSQGKCTCHS
jgi:hypothetical protein